MTAEALEFGAQAIKPLCLPQGMPASKLGSMTLERWKTLSEQFVEMKLADPANVQADKVFADEFVKRSGNE